MSPTTDFFGRVAEQSIDPLEPWQWVLCVIGTLALLALSSFLGAIFSDNYGGVSWLVALTSLVFLYPCLLPMFRAIPPGTNLYWWLLSGSIMVISVAFFFTFRHLGKTPNPIHAFGVPVTALGISTLVDLGSERLAGVPLAWPSFLALVGIGVLVTLAVALDQNR